MSLRPRFQGEDDEDPGFDWHATPRWAWVGRGDARSVFLVDGAGLDVRPNNPGVNIVMELSPPDGRREFVIEGKIPGTTYLEVREDPRSSVVKTRLEVSVKEELALKIAFQFVTDGLANPTTRDHTIAGQLVSELNNFFKPRADITFTMARAADVITRAMLSDILREQKPGDFFRPTKSWNQLIAEGDRGVSVNVFFMKFTKLRSGDEDRFEALGTDGDCVFSDIMPNENVSVALPHMIGRFLGCGVVTGKDQEHLLMHESRARGVAPITAAEDVVPRDCANTMNPPIPP